MKRCLIFSVLFSLLFLTGSVSAAGASLSGQVAVYQIGTRQYMQANPSVRHNTVVAGSPYVLANGYANSTVTFAGRDNENEYFSCYVLSGSPLYAAAVDAKNNLGNGSRLYVYKQANSGTCENFSLGQYSYFID